MLHHREPQRPLWNGENGETLVHSPKNKLSEVGWINKSPFSENHPSSSNSPTTWIMVSSDQLQRRLISIIKKHHAQGEAWWWQYQCLRLLLFSHIQASSNKLDEKQSYFSHDNDRRHHLNKCCLNEKKIDICLYYWVTWRGLSTGDVWI